MTNTGACLLMSLVYIMANQFMKVPFGAASRAVAVLCRGGNWRIDGIALRYSQGKGAMQSGMGWWEWQLTHVCPLRAMPTPWALGPTVLQKVVDLAIEQKYLSHFMEYSPDPNLVVPRDRAQPRTLAPPGCTGRRECSLEVTYSNDKHPPHSPKSSQTYLPGFNVAPKEPL